ncbi:MAG TPA: ACT domain-containing protein, partial [Opitutales bacterium]|nr:ACT domain-containing protein [Opitutales bacterium]
CKITVSDLPDKPGTAADIFKALSDEEILVDMIIQNVGRGGVANLTFTVSREDAERSRAAAQSVLEKIGEGNVDVAEGIAKLSVVGVGMRSHSGVAATLFQTLADNHINIGMISTSEIKISVVIDLERADEALRLVHEAYNL